MKKIYIIMALAILTFKVNCMEINHYDLSLLPNEVLDKIAIDTIELKVEEIISQSNDIKEVLKNIFKYLFLINYL